MGESGREPGGFERRGAEDDTKALGSHAWIVGGTICGDQKCTSKY